MPYKRGPNWIAQVRKNGQRREKVFPTKKEATEWEAEMRRKPASDWKKRIDTVCLGDWAQIYLDVAQSRFTAKTYDEKRSMFRRLFAEFDPATPVYELKPSKVMAFIVKQKEERSGYAANKDRKNLVAAWNWGMKYMDPPLPGPNPCLVDRMPEIRQPRYVPPEEDFWKVYEKAEGQDQIMLLAFLHLAARRGEIFRMTWSDVDFGNNRVRLWTRKRQGGSYEYDWLPMTKELRKYLMQWWEHRPVKDVEHVFVCLDNTAFCQEQYGKPFMYRQHFMNRLCDKAGVKRFGFHSIRHLSASILFKLGYELGAIQAILRHKSPGTTERYLKSIGLERVRDALEDLSRGKGKVVEFKPKRYNAAKVDEDK
jgi:integrase